MSYIVFYLLLLPLQKILSFFKKENKRNLVIQTAKIGDFINLTPMLKALGRSEIIINRNVEPLVIHDDNISHYYIMEDIKRNLFTKLISLFKLMNHFDNIYLVYPNSINLFFVALCNASNKSFLKTYRYKYYHKIFYCNATNIVEHSKKDLTINSYLKLINQNFSYIDFPKYATSPLYIPTHLSYMFHVDENSIKIGLSISASNKNKIIPTCILVKLIKALNKLPCMFFIFGITEDQKLFNKLNQSIDKNNNIVNLINKLKLEEVPWAISQMHFYISSDSGNAYIADAQNIPVIIFYGPCSMEEQRPLKQVLLIGPKDISASSFVFHTPKNIKQSSEILFNIDEDQTAKIINFIKNKFPQ